MDAELDRGARRLRGVEAADGLLDDGDVLGEVADADGAELLVGRDDRAAEAARERREHAREALRVAAPDVEDAALEHLLRDEVVLLLRLLRLRPRGARRAEREGEGEKNSASG